MGTAKAPLLLVSVCECECECVCACVRVCVSAEHAPGRLRVAGERRLGLLLRHGPSVSESVPVLGSVGSVCGRVGE